MGKKTNSFIYIKKSGFLLDYKNNFSSFLCFPNLSHRWFMPGSHTYSLQTRMSALLYLTCMQQGFMCNASSACFPNEASSLSISDIDLKYRASASASAAIMHSPLSSCSFSIILNMYKSTLMKPVCCGKAQSLT